MFAPGPHGSAPVSISRVLGWLPRAWCPRDSVLRGCSEERLGTVPGPLPCVCASGLPRGHPGNRAHLNEPSIGYSCYDNREMAMRIRMSPYQRMQTNLYDDITHALHTLGHVGQHTVAILMLYSAPCYDSSYSSTVEATVLYLSDNRLKFLSYL